MKKITAEDYEEGIDSFLIFSKMLEKALQEVLDPVKLRCESAYAWRGFQIMHCEGLADSQYYCQIYHGKPYILEFCEYYEMTHKPFMETLDLKKKGFYSLEYDGQKKMLIDFIRETSNAAKVWNKSPERAKIVPKKYL